MMVLALRTVDVFVLAALVVFGAALLWVVYMRKEEVSTSLVRVGYTLGVMALIFAGVTLYVAMR